MHLPDTLEGLARGLRVLDGGDDPGGHVRTEDGHLHRLGSPLPQRQHPRLSTPRVGVVPEGHHGTENDRLTHINGSNVIQRAITAGLKTNMFVSVKSRPFCPKIFFFFSSHIHSIFLSKEYNRSLLFRKS